MNKSFWFLLLVASLALGSCANKNLKKERKGISTINLYPDFIPFLKKSFLLVNDSTPMKLDGKAMVSSLVMKRFYEDRAFHPVWSDNFKPTSIADQMLELVANAQFYGLDTSLYQYQRLLLTKQKLASEKELHNQFEHATDFEIRMTYNALKFISHLKSGTIYPDTLIYDHKIVQYPEGIYKILTKAIESNDFKAGILNSQPDFREYQLAQKGLENYVKSTILNKDSFSLPDPRKDSLKCYNNAQNILTSIDYIPEKTPYNIAPYAQAAIRRVMAIPGMNDVKLYRDFYAAAEKNYDDSVFILALKQFQIDHGLGSDGVIGRNTRSALMKGNFQRFMQAAANLERLRWEREVPENYILVNIPSYKLEAIEKKKVTKELKVMVGTAEKRTPTLNSNIEYFIIHPEWNVPFSISSKEILPKIQKDPQYLARNNYRVTDLQQQPVDPSSIDWSTVDKSNFNYRITQSGGDGNALGTIKFIFPNKYSVYLHDTPSKRLFDQSIRAYSHGCMRLQNPEEFGEFLLQHDNPERIDTFKHKMKENEKAYFGLRKPLPIRIRYFTIEANENGNLIFYKDIYKKDDEIIHQLFTKRD